MSTLTLTGHKFVNNVRDEVLIEFIDQYVPPNMERKSEVANELPKLPGVKSVENDCNCSIHVQILVLHYLYFPNNHAFKKLNKSICCQHRLIFH